MEILIGIDQETGKPIWNEGINFIRGGLDSNENNGLMVWGAYQRCDKEACKARLKAQVKALEETNKEVPEELRKYAENGECDKEENGFCKNNSTLTGKVTQKEINFFFSMLARKIYPPFSKFFCLAYMHAFPKGEFIKEAMKHYNGIPEGLEGAVMNPQQETFASECFKAMRPWAKSEVLMMKKEKERYYKLYAKAEALGATPDFLLSIENEPKDYRRIERLTEKIELLKSTQKAQGPQRAKPKAEPGKVKQATPTREKSKKEPIYFDPQEWEAKISPEYIPSENDPIEWGFTLLPDLIDESDIKKARGLIQKALRPHGKAIDSLNNDLEKGNFSNRVRIVKTNGEKARATFGHVLAVDYEWFCKNILPQLPPIEQTAPK